MTWEKGEQYENNCCWGKQEKVRKQHELKCCLVKRENRGNKNKNKKQKGARKKRAVQHAFSSRVNYLNNTKMTLNSLNGKQDGHLIT